MKLSISKKIFFVFCSVLLFFFLCELAQRIRYSIRSESTYWMFYGLGRHQKPPFIEKLIVSLDTFLGWGDASQLNMRKIKRQAAQKKYTIPIVHQNGYWKMQSGPDESRGVKTFISPKGFRGEDFPLEKPKDEFRIVVIGGSSVYCINLDQEKTWPYLLQETFKKMNKHIRVINAGMSSFSMKNIGAVITHEIQYWNPDLIFIYENINNWENLSAYIAQKPKLNWLMHLNKTITSRSLFVNSLVEGIYVKLYKTAHSLYMQGRETNYYQFILSHEKTWDTFSSEVKNTLTIAKTLTRAKIILSSQWLRYKDYQDNAFRGSEADYHQIITKGNQLSMNIAQEQGVDVIDMAKYFSNFSKEAKEKLLMDEVHMTEAGAQQFTKIIFQQLMPYIPKKWKIHS